MRLFCFFKSSLFVFQLILCYFCILKSITNYLNMKKYLMLIALTMLLVSMSSCTTKQMAMNRLEGFSTELRDNSENYDLEQWKDALDKFVKIRKNIAKHHYTASERMQIGQTEGRCIGYIASGAKKGAINNIGGISSEVKGIIDGLMESEAK